MKLKAYVCQECRAYTLDLHALPQTHCDKCGGKVELVTLYSLKQANNEKEKQ